MGISLKDRERFRVLDAQAYQMYILQDILRIGGFIVNEFVKQLISKLQSLRYSGEYRYYEIYKFLNTLEYYEKRIEVIEYKYFDAQSVYPYMYKGKEFIKTSNHKRHRILASSVEKAFNSDTRTFDTYIQTEKWKTFESNYDKLKAKPYRIYKQFTDEYCGYYILPELLPDFIEYLTETKNKYIRIIHKALDKEYSRESIKYKDCAYVLLIYKSEYKKTIHLHFKIKYQYEFGDLIETEYAIYSKSYYLLKVGSKSELKEYLKKLLERLQKNMLTFKPTKINKYTFTIENQELQEVIDIINSFSINDTHICSCNDCQRKINTTISNHLPNPN